MFYFNSVLRNFFYKKLNRKDQKVLHNKIKQAVTYELKNFLDKKNYQNQTEISRSFNTRQEK